MLARDPLRRPGKPAGKPNPVQHRHVHDRGQAAEEQWLLAVRPHVRAVREVERVGEQRHAGRVGGQVLERAWDVHSARALLVQVEIGEPNSRGQQRLLHGGRVHQLATEREEGTRIINKDSARIIPRNVRNQQRGPGSVNRESQPQTSKGRPITTAIRANVDQR